MFLKKMDVEVNDKNQAIILLCSLPSSYSNFVDTLIYGRDIISMEIVKSYINSNEKRKRIAGGSIVKNLTHNKTIH